LVGRNNPAALAVLSQLSGLETLTIISAGTVDLSSLAQCQLRIRLYDIKPVGVDGDGFLPLVERKSLSSLRGSLTDWVLRR
jgi:hypothetical protein